MVRIALVSQTLAPMGGGAKDIAVTFLHLDREVFDPYVFSLSDPAAWREEYGIPQNRCRGVDIWNLDAITAALAGFDVVYLMVGTTNEPSEYETIWRACDRNGVKVRIMRIVFGLGNPRPELADLFLVSSMDAFLAGTPCRGCHVVYPPLPPHPGGDRIGFRARHGIGNFETVVGYSCADHRPEFFEVARRFHAERRAIVFLSALSRPDNFDVPPNVRFCGSLLQREMGSLYEASDVVLHTRTESFGYSPYQAMAAGVPVVALWTSSKNAFAETMYPAGGWLAKTTEGLVEAVKRSITDQPVIGPQRSAEAKVRASVASGLLFRMSPENSVRRIECLVLDCLRAKGHFMDAPRMLPNHYVTENDVRMWRTARTEIERRLASELYI